MKRLLLVLLVLGVSMPAGADVLVYNMKASNAEYKYNSDSSDSNAWGQIKDTNTAFVIFELPGGGSTNVWAVYTYKAKDPNGKTQNYCKGENWGTFVVKPDKGKVGHIRRIQWTPYYSDRRCKNDKHLQLQKLLQFLS
jgi:hypothetical protein